MATLPYGKEIFTIDRHHSLTNYFSQPTLNARQARWVDFLGGFDFEIKHLQGNENRVVDTLSRKLQSLYEISSSEWKSPFAEIIQRVAEQDMVYQQIRQQVHHSTSKEK